MALVVVKPEDPAEFIELALPFLLQEEATNCLLASILYHAQNDPARLGSALRVVVSCDGKVVAAALRTPIKLVLSHADDSRAMTLLAEEVHRSAQDLDMFLGPAVEARQFAESWTAIAKSQPHIWRRERIYRLDMVRSPKGVPGRLRQAEPQDRQVLVAWIRGFASETGETIDPKGGANLIDWWLRSGGLFVWEDGVTVSMAAGGGDTPNGARVNLVYTPQEFRRKGYAGALVAAVSQGILDRGKHFCCLYTDAENPTTNHIYQEIGYRSVCDVHDYRGGINAPELNP
jgi:uncharacterized protein